MIKNFFSKGINVILCWFAFLGWGVFLFNFGLYPRLKVQTGNADLPEETFGFNSELFVGYLDKLGDAGRVTYHNFQLFDFLNALLMGLAIFAAIYYLLNTLNSSGLVMWLLGLPVFAAIFDIIENSIIVYLISLSEQPEFLIQTTSLFTRLKLVFATLAFLAVLLIGIAVVFRKIISKKG